MIQFGKYIIDDWAAYKSATIRRVYHQNSILCIAQFTIYRSLLEYKYKMFIPEFIANDYKLFYNIANYYNQDFRTISDAKKSIDIFLLKFNRLKVFL